MGFKRRNNRNLVSLAKDLEAAQNDLAAAQVRVAGLQRQMVSAIESGNALSTANGPARSPANGEPRRKRRSRTVNWEAARENLLKSMKKGAAYAGPELQTLARTSVSEARFKTHVRDELLGTKVIKKVTVDGTPWRKGMSPRAVRWMKM